MFDECSDLDLVDNLKHNINIQDSLYELINRHSGIFYDMVNNYTMSFKNTYYREEIKDDIEFLFYRTCLRYNQERGTKFSTFLGNETKYHCLNFYNKNKKYYREPNCPYKITPRLTCSKIPIIKNTICRVENKKL